MNCWMEIKLYWFQADISHAYQILKKHGIPADRIVTMMYDDLAHSPKFVLICFFLSLSCRYGIYWICKIYII